MDLMGMKVLYIFRSLAVWGGIERVLVDKMNYLVSMYGYEVYMLTTCQGNHPVPYQLDNAVHLEDLGIQFHRQYQYRGLKKLWDGWSRTKRFERLLSERIRKIRPDVIICTTADPVYSITKVKGAIPLVVESHSICIRSLGEKSLHQRFVAQLLLKGLKNATCLVTLTEGDAVEWRKITSNVEVIPDMAHLNTGYISSLENKRIIFVGRFDYQKRPLDMIKVWQHVFPSFPDWHLDIYGEGELQQEVEDLANSLNMNIHIHTPTCQILDAYRNSSILVSTSLFEPFGLVLPEAMSCGLPVIAYDCPYGPSMIIINGENGYLVKSGDILSFADQLCSLMHDKDLRCRIGKAAVISSKQYAPDRIMPLWVNLFDRIHNGYT